MLYYELPDSTAQMQKHDFEDLHALEESLWWFAGMREITAALLDPLIAVKGDYLILDAGCGTGGNLEWLRRYSKQKNIVGIDVDSDAISFSHKRGHERLAQASVCGLPFQDASFDLVTSFDVLVQLPDEGADAAALREMHRVLRDGGILFVRVAAYEWMRSGHDQALATHYRYNLATLKEKIESAGFEVLRSTYANSLLLPAAVINRLVLKRLGLVDEGSDVRKLPPSIDWVEATFRRALIAEARWLRSNNLPAGLSAICIARKPST